MPRGNYDYGVSNKQYGQTSIDVYELAVRLGSPDILDRRGSVIHQDKFNNGLIPYVITLAGAQDCDVVNYRGYSNDHTCRLVNGVVTNNGGSLIKYYGLYSDNPYGNEVMFRYSYNGVNLPGKVDLIIDEYTGSMRYVYGFRINPSINQFQYYTIAGGALIYTPLAILPNLYMIAEPSNFFMLMKLVAGGELHRYVRGIFGSDVIDMSSLIPYSVASAIGRHIEMSIGWYGAVAAQPVYLSSIIHTIDEP